MAEGERWRSAARPAAPRGGPLAFPTLAWNRATVGVVSILIGLLLWEWVARQFMTQRFSFAPPSLVFETLVEMFLGLKQPAGSSIYWHIYVSLSEFFVGFALGALVGVTVGVLVAIFRPVDWALDPWIAALYATPTVALAPLFIMWFGYTFWPKLLTTVLVVFFPILVNVSQAVRVADRDLVNLARAYSMTPAQCFWKVLFPLSMPALMAGLRIGATLAVIGVTVGELVGGNTGLGFLITYGEGQSNTAMVFNAIVLLTVIGLVLYWVVGLVEKRVLHYV